jgi:hypothetical protein
MNAAEYSKFNKSLSEGYKELITKRPEKPMEHFIFCLLSKVPEEMLAKNEFLSEFYKNYQTHDLKNVKDMGV